MEMHERLRAAREYAGFDTAIAAAEAVGVPYPTYAGHENGSSGFRADKGALYARRFKVRFEWLMRETGPMTDLSSKHQDILADFDRLPPDLQESYAKILRDLAEPYKSVPPVPKRSRGAVE
jgi:hypothetical protein